MSLAKNTMPTSPARNRFARYAPRILWGMTLLSVAVWVLVADAGWDAKVLLSAVRSVHAGHDPYADAMAVQRQFHATLAEHPNATVPWSYVYPPITLPLLRFAAWLPVWFVAATYFSLYIAAMAAVLWVVLKAVAPEERWLFRFVAPVAIFFPGFLGSGVVMGGNVVILLYGAAFVAAWRGWRKRQWLWFYLVVAIAACFKPPLLTWLAIPVFSARRQWMPAIATAVCGAGTFVAQRFLMPLLFSHFLEAVNLQFLYNRDFGSSPAGLLGGLLHDHGLPYTHATSLFYVAYAVPLTIALYLLSRHYLSGRVTLSKWMPVLLTGVILLNPRVQEYDLLPLSVPMALIVWRFVQRYTGRPLFVTTVLFAVLNTIALRSWLVWQSTEGLLHLAVFAVGSVMILQWSKPVVVES